VANPRNFLPYQNRSSHKIISQADLTILQLTGAFALGTFFDIVSATYTIIPLLLYLWLIPTKIFQKKWHRFFLYGFFFVQIFLLIFNSVSEWLFWDEFTTRFNFIAVDYLVYTTEVIGNIQQSYPIAWIVVIIIIITAAIFYFIKSAIDQSFQQPMRFKLRSVWAAGILSLPILSFFLISNTYHNFSTNTIANELAGNGLYELFAAYRNNELNYTQFYPYLPEQEVNQKLASLMVPELATNKEAFA
jgi:hypothetical protein